MNRRDYLALLSTAGAGVLAGCPGSGPESDPDSTPESTPAPDGSSEGISTPSEREGTETPEPYQTVVNLAEAGADPTGENRIDSVVDAHAGSDTKLLLPEGRYRVGQCVLENHDRLALVGDSATLVPAETGNNTLLSFRGMSNLHVEGITVDQSASGVCGSISVQCVGGTNLVRDIALEGFIDLQERTHGFTVFCEGSDTELTFDQIDLTDGARNGTGVYVFPQRSFADSDRSPGKLVFRNCRMRDWRAEGLYASPHGGPISVIGGHYENNAIVQVRVGGGNADTAALVKDVTAIVDGPPDSVAQSDLGNFRGIWLEEGSSATVEGCTVEIRDISDGHSQGAIVVGKQFGQVEILDTDIRCDRSVAAISIGNPASEFDAGAMPGLDQLPSNWTVTCKNVRIRGRSDAGPAIRLFGRTDCTFENVNVDQQYGSRHGLLSIDSSMTQVVGGNWVTSGYPMMIGPTDQMSSGTDLLCFQNMEMLQSTQFDGSMLLDGQSADPSQQVCIPFSALPTSDPEPLIPYVGITGANDSGLLGNMVRGKGDGSQIVRL